MLDKQHGDYVFRCDQAGCDRELLTGTSNLEAARSLLRLKGWQPFRLNELAPPEVDTIWGHRCKGCLAARATAPSP
jgi:hypothetical protein